MRTSAAVTVEDLDYLRQDSLAMVLLCIGAVLYLWVIALLQLRKRHRYIAGSWPAP